MGRTKKVPVALSTQRRKRDANIQKRDILSNGLNAGILQNHRAFYESSRFNILHTVLLLAFQVPVPRWLIFFSAQVNAKSRKHTPLHYHWYKTVLVICVRVCTDDSATVDLGPTGSAGQVDPVNALPHCLHSGLSSWKATLSRYKCIRGCSRVLNCWSILCDDEADYCFLRVLRIALLHTCT